jgi:two-component system nitrogen regulation response regulator GlnG
LIEDVQNGDLLVDNVQDLTATEQRALSILLGHNEQRPVYEQFRVISIVSLTHPKPNDFADVRSDLLHLLTAASIILPPLKDRLDDIEGLSEHFLKKQTLNSSLHNIDKAALKVMKSYPWPGNVRELKNLMQVLALQSSSGSIEENMVMNALYSPTYEQDESDSPLDNKGAITDTCRRLLQKHSLENLEVTPYAEAVSWIEKPLITEALRMTGGNQLQAAKLLGIHRNTLRTKIKTLNIP